MHRIKDTEWLYWAATVPLLAWGVTGHRLGIIAASALCLVQAIRFTWRTRSAVSFPVQVRLTYLSQLLAGLWPPLSFLHWIQLVGTTARVLVGYCLLARLLSLLPWNRSEPLTWALVGERLLQSQSAPGSTCRATI